MPALKEGRYTDAANAAAGGVPLIGPAADALSAQWKGGDAAGAIGGIAALVTGPKLLKTAGHGMKEAATGAARLALNADRPTRAIALQHRALPGMLHGGLARTNTRLAHDGVSLTQRAKGRLTGNPVVPLDELVATHAKAPVSTNRITYAPDAWKQIKERFNTAPGKAAADAVVASTRADLNPTPTAGVAFNAAKGAYRETRGQSTPAAIMERALADNAMKEVARVVPGAAEKAANVRNLNAVSHAYAQPNPGLPPGMMPTLDARLAVAAANRLVGPATQGLYNMGRAAQMPAEAVRALMLQELLTRSGGER
jgi:hypothetical protein